MAASTNINDTRAEALSLYFAAIEPVPSANIEYKTISQVLASTLNPESVQPDKSKHGRMYNIRKFDFFIRPPL